MAGKGRPAIAPEVMEANGAYIKDPQRRNKSAPRANGRAPEMPDYLDEIEIAKWDELVADLDEMGILSTELREMLIAYVTAFSGWLRARVAVQEQGMVIVEIGANGSAISKRNPHSLELHKYRSTLDKLLPEFGLTPSARGRLVSLKASDGDENPFGELLARFSKNN